MGSRVVPANTRKVRIGTRNYLGVGPSITSLWDDFGSPTLETTSHIGVTYDFDIAFSASGALRIAAPDDLSPGDPGAPVVIQNFDLSLRGQLLLGLGMRKFPEFECAPPPVKLWDRHTPIAKTWSRHEVTPPEPCTPAETETGDLDLVSGDALVTVDAYRFKLVS
jgi:hypothetical protein